MTDNKIQFLTDDQIHGILKIVRSEYVQPQVKAKLQEIENSDAFKTEYEKVKNSEEVQKEYADALAAKENSLKLSTLLEQIKSINENYVIARQDNDYHGDCYQVTFDSIETTYTVEVSCIESRIKSKVYETLSLNSYDYYIVSQIIEELHTRLLLTIPTDLQTIIDNITNFINVDKYLTFKD
jgi:hypothetical protein